MIYTHACDFDIHACDFHTFACDFHTHACDFDTLRGKLLYYNILHILHVPAARMRVESTLCAALYRTILRVV
jgi:hypothetical protein